MALDRIGEVGRRGGPPCATCPPPHLSWNGHHFSSFLWGWGGGSGCVILFMLGRREAINAGRPLRVTQPLATPLGKSVIFIYCMLLHFELFERRGVKCIFTTLVIFKISICMFLHFEIF